MIYCFEYRFLKRKNNKYYSCSENPDLFLIASCSIIVEVILIIISKTYFNDRDFPALSAFKYQFARQIEIR